MIDDGLLEILVCPETHQKVTPALPERIESLNAAIAQGTLCNRAGQTVRESIDGGLVREDGQFLYPIRNGIPILLIDEAIPLRESG
jgi:uncharacterized protein YbaR (Trm112 family)